MDLSTIKPDTKKALFLLKRQLPEFVCDAVNLEGINYTLPEVQTLLDGITVGGHKLSDETITLNQAKTWKFLIESIESSKFSLQKDFACECHNIAAKEEALSWGVFRTGGVTIAGTDYLPPDANSLDSLWKTMIEQSKNIENIYECAIFIFLTMARTQFFYDVNERMGRFMMNGLLLSNGFPAINLPSKKQLEFNQLMLDFYNSNNIVPMTNFMMSCLSPQAVKIMSE
ncbi:MAG: Fic family protein [Fibrobacteria bacterium]|nr:Fic family protein [Fibrobacteria bacterium]